MSDGTLTAAVPRIHNAIVEIMRAVGPVAKSQNNKQQGFNYRGIDQVYNAVHPHFAEQGVYSTSTILDAKHIDGKNAAGKAYVHAILRMRFTFWAGDGSSVATEVIGEGIDYGGDKASNKAMSVADKYAILQLLKIPTAMVDADGVAIPTEESVNGNGQAKPTEPRKSVEELMKEAAAQAEGDKADAKESEFTTAAHRTRIEQLFSELGMTADQQTKAIAKRNASTLRDMKSTAAVELISTLELRLASYKEKREAKMELPLPGSSPGGATCGPCVQSQKDAINKAFEEWAQVDKEACDKAIIEYKKRLFAAGFKGTLDMSANDATRICNAIKTRSMDSFFQRSLEQWRPLEQTNQKPADAAAKQEAAENAILKA